MKNMKVGKKLILGFSIVALLTLFVGGFGVFGMIRINAADSRLYEEQTKPLGILAQTIDHLQRARLSLRNLIIYAGDMERVEDQATELTGLIAQLDKYLAEYDRAAMDQASRAVFQEARELYTTVFLPCTIEMQAGARAGMDQAALSAVVNEDTPSVNKMVELFNDCLERRIDETKTTVDGNSALAGMLLAVIGVMLALSMGIAMALAFYISSMISNPLRDASAFLDKMTATGDMVLPQKDADQIAKYSKHQDEIGRLVGSLAALIYRLSDIDKTLARIAGGDLTVEIKTLSEMDSLGLSLHKMVDSLNRMIGEIRNASEQVSLGAGQISNAAHALASGSSEQAASVEELSTAVSQLEGKTKGNSENAQHVKEMNTKAANLLTENMRSMERMLEAMREIDESSQKITRVIKVIDDIAFQTNILALNAAVEAARAGMHGKGFAVVAEEVRSLASKSAAAARETAELIEESSRKVNEGKQIVEQTNSGLEVAVQYARESIPPADEVTQSSGEQARAIEELNIGMSRISEVVQANSATAQESASTAQEMLEQTVALNEIASGFQLKQSARENAPRQAPPQGGAPERPVPDSASLFGKY